MKKIGIIINGVFAVAIIVLFCLYFVGKSEPCEKQPESKEQKTLQPVTEKVAYIDMDTFMLNYNFAKDADTRMKEKEKSAKSRLERDMKQFQTDVAEFQKKAKLNSFISQESAQKESMRLGQKQQELEQLQASLTQELMKETQKLSEQLRDSLTLYLKEYNKDGKYAVVLSSSLMTNTVLYAADGCDITNDVVEQLNKRYVKK